MVGFIIHLLRAFDVRIISSPSLSGNTALWPGDSSTMAPATVRKVSHNSPPRMPQERCMMECENSPVVIGQADQAEVEGQIVSLFDLDPSQTSQIECREVLLQSNAPTF